MAPSSIFKKIINSELSKRILHLKYISYIVGLFIQFDILCLLTGVVSPFTVNVIIDMVDLNCSLKKNFAPSFAFFFFSLIEHLNSFYLPCWLVSYI